MEVVRQTLKMLFLRRSWLEIINSLNKDKAQWADVGFSQEWFLESYTNSLKNYSLDQLSCFYNSFLEHWMKRDDDDSLNYHQDYSVYNAVLNFSSKVLKLENNEKIVCRFNSVLRWHDVTSYLGEDLFTTAYLASNDILKQQDRKNFLWEAVIETDKGRLNEMMKCPISDNHFHLFGSSMVFEINWLGLMNNLASSKNKLKQPFACLKHGPSVYKETENMTMYSLLGKAAAIRMLLYFYIMSENIANQFRQTVIDVCKSTDDNELVELLTGIDSTIQGFKEGKNMADYAIQKSPVDIAAKHPSQMMSFFSGERYIMYSMFKRIFKNNCDDYYSLLFYLYLVLKVQIRQEFVHTNEVPGLKNFQNYNKAKGVGYKNGDFYYKLSILSAVNQFVFRKNRKLEIRIVPPKENNFTYDINGICDIFKTFGENKSKCITENIPYFIIHFPKRKDISKYQQCRHKELRDKIKKTALAIAKYKLAHDRTNENLVGVDAAGAELDTRPEVFSQAFRYLRLYVPNIKMTYHIGEDFLDVVDGLRSVDELLRFCEWSKYDRLGHALVLGQNVRHYYYRRDNWIALPLQVLVDNIVWLRHKASVFEDISVAKELDKLYEKYFLKLYNMSNIDYPCNVYYQSWLLRGDNPQRYNGTYNDQKDFWSSCDQIKKEENLQAQANDKAVYLFRLYHYNKKIKENGQLCVELKISKRLVSFIDIVREGMLNEIEKQGFMVECNPSSNFKIGDIDRYINHPIFKFYTTPNLLKLDFTHNISVSINTDDKGIFNTSLEREYALLAAAYSKEHTTKQEQSDLFEWLDSIRKMGLEQSFVPTNQ